MPTLFKNGVYFFWRDSKFKIVYDKRAVDLDEVVSVFQDPNEITQIDDRFDYDEERLRTIGMSKYGRLLVVAWTEVDDENVTIITVYKPSDTQIKEYSHAN
ncbi:MAG: BrnT family toxin [Moraxella sp.]|nr:BrnT family toxin [Moraxella sp.]